MFYKSNAFFLKTISFLSLIVINEDISIDMFNE